MPLARVRKFARRTRAYRRAYQSFGDGMPSALADVERLMKGYKSHRAANVFDKAFCEAE